MICQDSAEVFRNKQHVSSYDNYSLLVFQNQNISDVENQSSMFPLGKWHCFNLKYKLIKKNQIANWRKTLFNRPIINQLIMNMQFYSRNALN